jgi:CPA2 family monovalent cation:H+ antiporter-2
VIGLTLIKSGVLGGLALAFGLPRGAAIRLAMVLGGGGEFAFVAAGLAVASQVVSAEAGQLLLIVVGLSMALTPLLSALAVPLEQYLDKRTALAEQRELDATAHAANHVVIIGFGWVGQLVARLLTECGILRGASTPTPNA